MSTGEVTLNSPQPKISLLFQAQKQLARGLELSNLSRLQVTKKHPTVLKRVWVTPPSSEAHYTKRSSHETYSTRPKQKETVIKDCCWEELEVQQLTALIVPHCSGSKVIERIDAKRKARHDATLKEFYTELTNVGRDLERKTVILSTGLQDRLAASRKDVHHELQSLTGCMDMLKEREVLHIWENNNAAYQRHQMWIQEFKCNLQSQEDYRIEKSLQLLRQVHRELLHIGYESPQRIHNLLFQEALTIEKTALCNRQRITSLCCHLILLDVEAQKLQYLQWKMKKQNWVKDAKAAACRQYRNLLESLAIGSGGYISKDAIRKFRVEEHFLCLKRVKLLSTVRLVKPPCNQDSVRQWLDSVILPMRKHEELVSELKTLLTTNMDAIFKQCDAESEKIKNSLVSREVCSIEMASHILETSLPPLAEEYLLDITLYIERITKQAEYQKDSIDGMQDGVFTKLEMAVKIWELHQEALSMLRDSVQYKVDNIQNDQDQACQELEKSIAVELDNMREENSKSGLTARFATISTILEDIRKVYIRSHKSQMKIVRNYPKQVVKELNRYRLELEKFFGPVAGYLLDSSTDPKSKDRGGAPISLGGRKQSKVSVCAIEDFPVVGGAFHGSTVSSESADRKSKAFKLTMQTMSWHSINLDDFDLRRHPGGTYSTPDMFCPKDKSVSPTVAMAHSEPQIRNIRKHEPWLGFETRLQQLHRIICINFAAHWEQWMRETTEKARCEADAKAMELSNELELRLRLHAPRQGQIEDSVVRLRAAELVYHSDRVKRHVEGVGEELASLQKSLLMLKDRQGNFLQKLDEKLQETENVCSTLGFSALIEDSVDKMRVMVEKHIENHKEALKKFRNDVNEVLTYLRHSNGTFSKSFKNFANQGNFSDEEASALTEQLNKVYPMITGTEYAILTAVQQLENECIQGGMVLHRRIDSKFGYSVFDADFLEKIQRWLTNMQVKITAEVKIINLEDAEVNKNAEKLHKRLENISEKGEAMSFSDSMELLSHYRKISDGLVFRGLRLGILRPIFSSRYEELIREFEVVKIGDRMMSLMSPVASPAPSDKPADKEKGPSDKPSRGKSEVKAKQSMATMPRPKPGVEPAVVEQPEYPTIGPFRAYLKSLLTTVNTELLIQTEQFYRQKGERPISCPDVLPETFDQCAKEIGAKLKNYWDQIEAYFQQCVCAYLDQLQNLDKLLAQLCKASFPAYLQYSEMVLGVKLTTCLQEMETLQALWQESQAMFQDKLRPRLGHPKAAQALQVLKGEEEMVFEKIKQQIKQLNQDQQELLAIAGKNFTIQLANFTEFCLKEMDNILSPKDLRDDTASLTEVCVQETISGRLRRLLQGVGSAVASSTSVTEAPTPVTGLPYLDWEDEEEEALSASSYRATPTFLITRKTPNHATIVAARDGVYTSYKERFYEALDNLKNDKDKMLAYMEKWHTEWVASTKTLTESYSQFYPTFSCYWQEDNTNIQ